MRGCGASYDSLRFRLDSLRTACGSSPGWRNNLIASEHPARVVCTIGDPWLPTDGAKTRQEVRVR